MKADSVSRAPQMIQYGFDVNRGDYDNRTALMLAVVGNHSAAVNTLLGAGADANLQVLRRPGNVL